MDPMLTLIAIKPHIVFEWGTLEWGARYTSSTGALTQKNVVFCPAFEYVGPDRLRAVVRSTNTIMVHASGADDEEVFQTFNRALLQAEKKCRPPVFMKWSDAVREGEFVVAEKALISTPSFRAQFFEVARRVDTLTAKLVHYRGSLWSLASDVPIYLCQMFLDEFFRRESLNLSRLDPDEFFGRIAASDASAGGKFVRSVIPETVRHEVWRRDQGRCTRCGSQQRLEFDHIIPLSKGGSNTARTIQLLCEPCNRAKGDTVGRLRAES